MALLDSVTTIEYGTAMYHQIIDQEVLPIITNKTVISCVVFLFNSMKQLYI